MTDTDFTDAAFQAQMAELRKHYFAGLPARRAALAAAWAACTNQGDEAPWLSLRDGAHKLSGSASSYGFEATGVAAHELDRLLSGRTPCRLRAGVTAAVEQLIAALDAAIAAG